MNETLNPCPFCDNEMHFSPTDQPKGWLVDGRHKSSCPFSIMTYDDCTAFVTREAAAESWNTRAELGSGTCRFIDDSDGELPPKCSVCGYEPSIYECSWLGDGGYEFEGNYCPNCGARVKEVGE